MRLLWLPEVLRAAGLTVHLYPKWEGRGSEEWGEDTRNTGYRMPLQGLICHATASSLTSTPAGDTRVLWETGSNTAPVPISQLYLARDGSWWVGASGRCNHALVGTKGPLKGFGNYQLIGVEAANNNLGEAWPAVQVDSYHRGVAAICRRMGWTSGRVAAHWEHQDGKSDPVGIDMGQFRQRVTALINQPSTMEDDEMPYIMWGAQPNIATTGYLVPDGWVDGKPVIIPQGDGTKVRNWILGGMREKHPPVDKDNPKGTFAPDPKYWHILPTNTPWPLATGQAAEGGAVDPKVVAYHVAGHLAPVIKAETRDALADLAEGGAAKVRAE